MMNFQRGQSMVEFAIVLPFLLFICGLMLVICLMFADYVQVQYEARSLARGFSVSTENSQQAIQMEINNYKKEGHQPTLFLYDWSRSTINVKPPESSADDNGYWTVAIKVPQEDTNTGFWVFVKDVNKTVLPYISAQCTMYSEKNFYQGQSNEPIRR